MSVDEEGDRRAEALQEYFFVEQMIDNFDNRALQIKSWSVTISGVALAAGFSQDPRIFLLASAASAAFWYIEATWKSFQRILMSRAHELEAALATTPFHYAGPQISGHFKSSFDWKEKLKRFPRVLFYDNTFLPHLLIVVAGIALYFFAGKIVKGA